MSKTYKERKTLLMWIYHTDEKGITRELCHKKSQSASHSKKPRCKGTKGSCYSNDVRMLMLVVFTAYSVS